MPLLDRLEVVARIGQLQQDEDVGHARDRRLALADADGLDDDHVEAGRLARPASPRACAPPPRPASPPDGDGRMNASRMTRELLHPRLVAEDGAAGERARGVDREHRDPMAGTDQPQAERLDERGLACTRARRDAHPDCAARMRQQRREQRRRARDRCSARVDSIKVIAFASARRLPARTPAARASTSGAGVGIDVRAAGRTRGPSGLRDRDPARRANPGEHVGALSEIGVPGP